MKRLFKEKLILLGIFLIFYILIEMMMFTWLKLGFFPKFWLVDLLVMTVFASLSLIFKKHKTSIFYLSFFIFIAGLLALVNNTMNYELNGEIFSVMHLLYADEAANVFVADFLHWDSIVAILAVFLLYGITLAYVSKLFFKPYLRSPFYLIKTFPILVVTLIVLLFTLNVVLPSYREYNDATNVSLFKRSSIKKYGMMGFYVKEIDSLLFSANDDIDINDLKEQLVLEDPNDFDESDLEIPYAGLLEGMNVITIMIESGQSFAVNPVLTPNLYKMTTEGLFFPNHHAENKTVVSETIGILGHYPNDGIMTKFFDYDFSYSMPNVLNRQGYRTVYFHENLSSFYSRTELTPALGFEEGYYHEDFFPDEKIYGWGGDYTLDSRTMERMLDYMFTEDDGEPFYYYWTTLVAHGPYNRNYPSVRGKNNLQKFTELGYFDQIDQAEANGDWFNIMDDSVDPEDPGRMRYYQAAMMDFDVALGILLDALEAEGILDDTLIVLYGDHNLFYHQMHLRINDVQMGEVHYPYIYKTFFSIYNPKLTQAYLANNPEEDTQVDKFISTYDLLPTYYHLLGIPYYINFTLGESIFTDIESIFYSHKITAFLNSDFFTYSENEIYYPENIDLNHNKEANKFLISVDRLAERILWIETWMDATVTRKE